MEKNKLYNNFFENLKKFNYSLKDAESFQYVNLKQKVIIINNETNIEYTVTFRDFADGYLPHRCNKKKTIEDFKKEVYALVGDEFEVCDGEIYINNKTPIKMKHKKCGRIIDTLSPNTFLAGKRCKFCAGHYTYSKEELQEKISKIDPNYEIIKYSGSMNKEKSLMLHKTCGARYQVSITNFFNGRRCPTCSHGSVRKTNEEFQNEIYAKFGKDYEIISDYQTCKDPIKIKHLTCGKTFEVIPNHILNKNKIFLCPKCYPSCSSTPEIEIKNFIESLNFKVQKIRKKINGKFYEIDCFIPELNIGIEYDGMYWHSEKRARTKLNLYEKTKAYESIGIRIIHILDSEYLKNKELILSKIKNFLQNNRENKIMARKCYIKLLDRKESNDFLNKYHTQGEDKPNYRYGLFNNNELVAVMTFSKLRKSLGSKDSEEKFELSRYATKYLVNGGFSKLLKHFIKENPTCKEIITYLDLRWGDSQKNVYTKNNFILDHISKPTYWYFSGLERLHRYNFRKQILKKKFPELYDDNLTEFQIMDQTKYRRIWDCGNAVYKYYIK